MIDFKIENNGKISQKFIELGVENFEEACELIKNLPYKRNSCKENELCVLQDLGGTCSTKHALLKRLADENGVEVSLILGIFNMNDINTPKISKVLFKYHLSEIPEAHNYLKYKDLVLGFTERNWDFSKIEKEIIEEIEIFPSQITHFKVAFQKKYIYQYLLQHSEIQYSLEKFWEIREECILALQR